MTGKRDYSRGDRRESRYFLANGRVSCPAPLLSIGPRFPRNSSNNVAASSAGAPSRSPNTKGQGWLCCSTNHRPCPTSRRRPSWICIPTPSAFGGDAGPKATSPCRTRPGAGGGPIFPPRDQAVVKAIACEAVSQTQLPLSRLSSTDLAAGASTALGKPISPSTVWRILDADAIKPWRYEYWIFPRDPRFAEKAGRVLDLYAGSWEDKPLGRKDYIISSDEKTGIQARIRCHPTLPTAQGRPMRVEHEYERGGALQYLAAWDVRRGQVLGRCEERTGIESFGRLVEQVMRTEPSLPVGRPRLLGRGQRLVASRPGGDQSVAQGVSQGGAGPHAGACQLAQPGGDLLLDHPEEGADPERLRQPGGSRTAVEVVRGVDEPRASTVRLEI
jgi:hypothetical protein